MLKNFLVQFDNILWEGVLIYLLLGVGIYFTVRLKGMQFRYLPYALKLAFSRQDDQAEGDISQFQSLMTALAATIGIGSIAGMAQSAAIGHARKGGKDAKNEFFETKSPRNRKTRQCYP